MKTQRVVAPEKGRIELEPYETPELEPGKVLVKTHFSTISPGTELAFLHAVPNTPGRFPTHFGYSACGEIIDAGSDVDALTVGAMVAVQLPHSGAATKDANDCSEISAGLDPVEVSAFRLASISLQGVRKAQIQLGESIAVIGLGTIGNLAGQLGRAAGSTRVVGIDPLAWRRDLAMECGFDDVFPSTAEAGGAIYEIAIEATGAPAPINDAFLLPRKYGRVVLLGSTRGETPQVNFYRDVHKKALTVIGAHDSSRPQHEDFGPFRTHMTDTRTVLDLLSSRRINLRRLISDVMPAAEAARAYERLARRDEQLITIALDWRGM